MSLSQTHVNVTPFIVKINFYLPRQKCTLHTFTKTTFSGNQALLAGFGRATGLTELFKAALILLKTTFNGTHAIDGPLGFSTTGFFFPSRLSLCDPVSEDSFLVFFDRSTFFFDLGDLDRVNERGLVGGLPRGFRLRESSG